MKSTGAGWPPIQEDWCPHKKGEFGERHIQEGVEMKAETRVMLPCAKEAKDSQQTLPGSWGRGRE